VDQFNLVDKNPESKKKPTRLGRLFGRKKIASDKPTENEPPSLGVPASKLAQKNALPSAFPPIEPTQPAVEKSAESAIQPTDPSAALTAVQPIHPAATQPASESNATAMVQPMPQQMDPVPTESSPTTASSPNAKSVVSVRDITKVYTMGDMEVHALRGINLDIRQGEMIAVMGPSGSGKSTLMNIIGCLDVPTAGEYLLDGVDVSKLNDNELAEIRCHKIGFVFQSFNLLSRTSAIANVELPLIYSGNSGSARRKRAADSLSLVGLGDRLDHRPNELSGGQQQRVAIARSLINQPAMILADEPTGNLDTATSVEIMHLFQQLNRNQGITIVFVTHDPETAEYCQRVVHFRDGVIERDERK